MNWKLGAVVIPEKGSEEYENGNFITVGIDDGFHFSKVEVHGEVSDQSKSDFYYDLANTVRLAERIIAFLNDEPTRRME
jgi:hypothetical protein